ncbi:heparinase II/III family protein [Bosea sp. (in: a-proteobacteria)]|uniref:heparinase II/III family protein n=1 Tax=Bosea sp. (in: a-proteobacteria) TaxID=1871050 RepID=UPI0026200ED0|nr:heparinase II/III family protein [Bosea sp. (in: a-proteobacteria)]MCO5090167.1 heparinase II/III family protein [Bosea sp. (in: a-proteobacteria)]
MAQAAIGRAARRTRGQFVGATRKLWPFGRSHATRLLFAPHDLRTADPTTAGDFYAGYYAFAGRTLRSHGESPFDAMPPSEAWAEALYGFGWLRHMRAADTAIARANARSLVEDFIAKRRHRHEIARRPTVAARRLISLLSHSPLLLEGADHVFYERYLRHVSRLSDRVGLALAGAVEGADRLNGLIAVAFAAICLDGQDGRRRRIESLLSDALDEQILPDGGHLSRNPRLLIEFLLDLLPLRETFAARGLEPPRGVLTAIERMMPHLRLFRHGDGALALFNGMGTTPPDLMATLAAYDDARGRPTEHAAYSGYSRLSAERSIVVVDAGAPPRGAYSVEAHAGCLAFEFSSGAQRIVVNCGASRFGPPELKLAARSTAAHSTLVLADRSSANFGMVLGQMRIVAGPRDVRVARQDGADGPEWVASHDGYRRSLGAVHTRRLLLARDGASLAGEDEIALNGAHATLPAALRFHLHPNVRVSLVREGSGAMLALASGEVWSFEAQGLAITVEESIFLAASDGRRRIEQLVVAFDAVATPRVAWRFGRISTANPRARQTLAAALAERDTAEPDPATPD